MNSDTPTPEEELHWQKLEHRQRQQHFKKTLDNIIVNCENITYMQTDPKADQAWLSQELQLLYKHLCELYKL